MPHEANVRLIVCVCCGVERVSGQRARRPPSARAPQGELRRDFDVLITNGRIVDGTGAPWYRADVGITGDRITAIGKLAGRAGEDAHRCVEPGGRAGLHRHARAVGVQRPGRPARGEQDHAGHHHRDHRRGRVDRAAQRRAGEVGDAAVRALQGDARLPDARRVLRAPGAHPAGAQRRHVRRRRRRARLRGRPGTARGHARGARRRCGRWSRRRCRTARSGVSTSLQYVPGRFASTEEIVELARVAQGARRHLHLASALGVEPDHPVARRGVRRGRSAPTFRRKCGT